MRSNFFLCRAMESSARRAGALKLRLDGHMEMGKVPDYRAISGMFDKLR